MDFAQHLLRRRWRGIARTPRLRAGRAATACLAAGVAVVLTLVAAPAAHAGLVNIQFGFVGDHYTPATPAYTGAGALGTAGDWWNTFEGPFGAASAGTDLPLSDATHAATSVALSYSGFSGFDNTVNGIFPPLMGNTGYANLLDSFAYTTGTATLTLSGLMAGASYDLVLYAVADTAGRQSLFTADGLTQSVVAAATPGLVAGSTYTEFLSLTADADGKLTIQVRGNKEADINGLQLAESVAMPEPGTLTLVAAAMTVLGWSQVRRQPRV